MSYKVLGNGSFPIGICGGKLDEGRMLDLQGSIGIP
jgi:hypothetical protein